MADYSAKTRSNYFHVRDMAAFREFAAKRNLDAQPHDEDETLMALFVDGSTPDGYTDETGKFIEEDFFAELAKHLLPGDVAVLVEVGSEKFRYLAGQAVAVNHEGKMVWVDLHEIYDKARRELGGTVTEASY